MNSFFTKCQGLSCLFIAGLFLLAACKPEEDPFEKLDLLDKLNSLEGVTAIEIAAPSGFQRAFQLDIEQPVDHSKPSGGSFTQRVYLSHVDEKSPVVFAPNGYRAGPSGVQEITLTLLANQVHVTHRYFQDAMPHPVDWRYLNIQQAAADHHRVVQLLKKIYKGKWISSGASKSGLASLFHKRYYPGDVNATIAYVAPFTFGPKDQRFPEYLAAIGGNGCFEKLKQVQVYVLNHREEMKGYMESVIKGDPYAYSLDRDLLLELHIMDYPFTFWQYYNFSCSIIPDTSVADGQEIFTHYSSIVPVNSFSDENINYFHAYAYQAVTELGAPAYQTDYLEPWLKKLDSRASGNPNYELLAPGGPDYTFTYSTIPEIYSWLQNEGDHIIYIYGKNDPWSGGAIGLNASADALFVMQENANHRVRISDLANPEQVYDQLEEWLGIPVPAAGAQVKKAEAAGFRLE